MEQNATQNSGDATCPACGAELVLDEDGFLPLHADSSEKAGRSSACAMSRRDIVVKQRSTVTVERVDPELKSPQGNPYADASLVAMYAAGGDQRSSTERLKGGWWTRSGGLPSLNKRKRYHRKDNPLNKACCTPHRRGARRVPYGRGELHRGDLHL